MTRLSNPLCFQVILQEGKKEKKRIQKSKLKILLTIVQKLTELSEYLYHSITGILSRELESRVIEFFRKKTFSTTIFFFFIKKLFALSVLLDLCQQIKMNYVRSNFIF